MTLGPLVFDFQPTGEQFTNPKIASIAVEVACEFVTAGAGTIGCAALAGAVGSMVSYGMTPLQPAEHGWVPDGRSSGSRDWGGDGGTRQLRRGHTLADGRGLLSPGRAAQSPVEADCPASSAQTQKLLGWRPVQPGLIADLEQGHYFETVAAASRG